MIVGAEKCENVRERGRPAFFIHFSPNRDELQDHQQLQPLILKCYRKKSDMQSC